MVNGGKWPDYGYFLKKGQQDLWMIWLWNARKLEDNM